MPTRLRIGRVSTVAVIAFIVAGCGGDDARKLPMSLVSGTVTYSTALPDGQIVFEHASGEPAATKFGPDGKYEVEVPQGKNRILVRSMDVTLPQAPAEGGAPGPRGMEIHKSRIPERYNTFETSGLTYEVKEGPQTYDVKLEDK